MENKIENLKKEIKEQTLKLKQLEALNIKIDLTVKALWENGLTSHTKSLLNSLPLEKERGLFNGFTYYFHYSNCNCGNCQEYSKIYISLVKDDDEEITYKQLKELIVNNLDIAL